MILRSSNPLRSGRVGFQTPGRGAEDLGTIDSDPGHRNFVEDPSHHMDEMGDPRYSRRREYMVYIA